MKYFYRLLLLWITLLLSGCNSEVQKTEEYVDTTTGSYYGIIDGATTSYKGMMYADASQTFRWSKAGVVEDSTNPRVADKFGKVCYQSVSTPNYMLNNMSENCLSVNVWVPTGSEEIVNKRVMIFIHGGGFIGGSSSNPLYNGAKLSEFNDAIVVNFNYRLGALGFLKVDSNSGNYGIMDQQAALEWVYSNIDKFGGDKNSLTLFGHSAGSMSTLSHILSNTTTKTKFKNAIVESSYMGFDFKDEKSATAIAEIVLNSIKKSSSKSPHDTDAKTVQDVSMELYAELIGLELADISFESFFPYSPYVDGSVIKSKLIKAQTTVPLLIGNVNAESNFMFESLKGTKVIDLYTEYVKKYYDSSITIGSQPELQTFFTNYAFECATNYFLKNNTSYTTNYLYHFNYIGSFNFWGTFNDCAGEACHASELPFVFGNFYNQKGYEVYSTSSDQQFSKKIMSIWKEFSQTSKLANFDTYQTDQKMISITNTQPNFFNVDYMLSDKCTQYNKFY
ncbi:MAG: carboxylesterase family protein [Helicobacteraceae bacterium]|nr:carboxylesterase family protein [Helicobacteraceae bacterium]